MISIVVSLMVVCHVARLQKENGPEQEFVELAGGLPHSEGVGRGRSCPGPGTSPSPEALGLCEARGGSPAWSVWRGHTRFPGHPLLRPLESLSALRMSQEPSALGLSTGCEVQPHSQLLKGHPR